MISGVSSSKGSTSFSSNPPCLKMFFVRKGKIFSTPPNFLRFILDASNTDDVVVVHEE